MAPGEPRESRTDVQPHIVEPTTQSVLRPEDPYKPIDDTSNPMSHIKSGGTAMIYQGELGLRTRQKTTVLTPT